MGQLHYMLLSAGILLILPTAFREAARRNVETLKTATIDDLVHAGWGSGRK